MQKLDVLSPANASVPGEFIRYLVSGVVAAAAYVAVTLGLNEITGLPLQAAIPIGFSVGVSVNFLLQRRYTFAHVGAYAIDTRVQAILYALLCLVQYGLTAAGTALMPRITPLSERLAYLSMVALMPLMSFVLLRLGIFRRASQP